MLVAPSSSNLCTTKYEFQDGKLGRAGKLYPSASIASHITYCYHLFGMIHDGFCVHFVVVVLPLDNEKKLYTYSASILRRILRIDSWQGAQSRYNHIIFHCANAICPSTVSSGGLLHLETSYRLL